jgi:hypothetical protein
MEGTAPTTYPKMGNLREHISSMCDVRNTLSLKDWKIFAEKYSERFDEIHREQRRWEVSQKTENIISQSSGGLKATDYGKRMLCDPHATAELLEALSHEKIDQAFDTPNRVWADLGTGIGVLAAGMAIRAMRMRTLERRIIAVDFNDQELQIAKIMRTEIGLTQIEYIHGDLEDEWLLQSIFPDAKSFPSLIACELVGNRKNYLYEEGDSYTATMIRLHRMLKSYQIDPENIQTVPRAVYAGLFNSVSDQHFWANSPVFRLGINSPEVLYGKEPHPNARQYAEPEIAYLQSLYSGESALSTLKQYKQLGIHSITLGSQDPRQFLNEVGNTTRPPDYIGPRRWA